MFFSESNSIVLLNQNPKNNRDIILRYWPFELDYFESDILLTLENKDLTEKSISYNIELIDTFSYNLPKNLKTSVNGNNIKISGNLPSFNEIILPKSVIEDREVLHYTGDNYDKRGRFKGENYVFNSEIYAVFKLTTDINLQNTIENQDCLEFFTKPENNLEFEPLDDFDTAEIKWIYEPFKIPFYGRFKNDKQANKVIFNRNNINNKIEYNSFNTSIRNYKSKIKPYKYEIPKGKLNEHYLKYLPEWFGLGGNRDDFYRNNRDNDGIYCLKLKEFTNYTLENNLGEIVGRYAIINDNKFESYYIIKKTFYFPFILQQNLTNSIWKYDYYSEYNKFDISNIDDYVKNGLWFDYRDSLKLRNI